MRYLLATVVFLMACGGATDVKATRYNFAVIDGRNQISKAGDATLAKPIVAELTRDPQGKFATRALNFFAPAVAYAQQLTLTGDPVPNRIVCGRESGPGEPKVVPLCAYTLADGKAANTVQGGTKAGTYNILFTAQVPSAAPIVDSTTVTVEAGPADPNLHTQSAILANSVDTALAKAVVDVYGNATPYRIQGDKYITVAGDVAGTPDARRISFISPDTLISNVLTPIYDANGVKVATFDYTLYPKASGGGWTYNTWGTAIKP